MIALLFSPLSFFPSDFQRFHSQRVNSRSPTRFTGEISIPGKEKRGAGEKKKRKQTRREMSGTKFEESLKFTTEVKAAFDPRGDSSLIEETSQNFETARSHHGERQLELRRSVQQLTDSLRTAEEATQRHMRPECDHRVEADSLSAHRDALSAQAAADSSGCGGLMTRWSALDAESTAVTDESERLDQLEKVVVPMLEGKVRLFSIGTNLVWTKSTAASASAVPSKLSGCEFLSPHFLPSTTDSVTSSSKTSCIRTLEMLNLSKSTVHWVLLRGLTLSGRSFRTLQSEQKGGKKREGE